MFTNTNKNSKLPVFSTDILTGSSFSLSRNYKTVPITFVSTTNTLVNPLDIVMNTSVDEIDRSALFIQLQNIEYFSLTNFDRLPQIIRKIKPVIKIPKLFTNKK